MNLSIFIRIYYKDLVKWYPSDAFIRRKLHEHCRHGLIESIYMRDNEKVQSRPYHQLERYLIF
jgi:hypothetical protein